MVNLRPTHSRTKRRVVNGTRVRTKAQGRKGKKHKAGTGDADVARIYSQPDRPQSADGGLECMEEKPTIGQEDPKSTNDDGLVSERENAGGSQSHRGEGVEVKSHKDGAWYEANISVVLRNPWPPRLLVDFFQFSDDKEFIDGPKEANRRVRHVSRPTQRGRCGEVLLGEVVCVRQMDPSEATLMWFDARVRCVCRNHFDGRCHCSYSVCWIDSPSRGEREWVRPDVVCRRSAGDEGLHPVVREYMGEWHKWHTRKSARILPHVKRREQR